MKTLIAFSSPIESNGEAPLLVGSFNIQSLGPTKIARPEFVSFCIQILAKYDIILIQEIKDSSVNNTEFNKLMTELNKFSLKYIDVN